MRNEFYHPGEEVIIRDWDDMVIEFGVNDEGHIPCQFTFLEEMKVLCGEKYTIPDEYDGVSMHVMYINSYNISKDMIAHYDDKECDVDEEFISFIEQFSKQN